MFAPKVVRQETHGVLRSLAACAALVGGTLLSCESFAAPQWSPTQADLNELAQRFRPYLKFSTGNRQEARPITWQRLYEFSKLKEGDTTIVEEGGLSGANAAKVLQFADIRSKWPAAKAYSIVIDDAQKYGEYWQSIAQGDGVYAHVSWLGPLTTAPNANRLVNIEYWVLFGFNVGYVPKEDHYGDVVGVQIVYDHDTDKIVRAAFSEHGRTLIMFDLWGATVDPSAVLHGKDANGKPVAQTACKLSVGDHAYWAGGIGGGPGVFTGSEKHVFMAKDPNSNGCEHLAVYLEHGSHETWPNQTGYFIGVAAHNGDDFSVLPASVHVLDPTNSADDPFTFFGGSFGDPTALMRHKMWLGYNRDAATDQDPYVDRGDLKWLPALPAEPTPPTPTPLLSCTQLGQDIVGLEKRIYTETENPPPCPGGVKSICSQQQNADREGLLKLKAEYSAQHCPLPVPTWGPPH